jgi:raffinose/stachyose/melibiose transport system permease protein
MNLRKVIDRIWLDIVSLIIAIIIFIVPFVFMLMTASKSPQEAALLRFNWPDEIRLFENIREVLAFGDQRMYQALLNSAILTTASVTLIIFLAALVGFVMQRRQDRTASFVSSVMLAGLIIPPSVVPTIFVLQWLGIYKTLIGMILVEVAFLLPFATLIFRTFMSAIPRDLDEAAIMDGAGPLRVFFSVILPLLRPAIVTVIVISSVAVYNDFVGPLYFLPGNENVTVQLTLYSFISQFSTRWNLLFADAIIITIPPLILFIFFQRQIVSGMTAGAVRG